MPPHLGDDELIVLRKVSDERLPRSAGSRDIMQLDQRRPLPVRLTVHLDVVDRHRTAILRNVHLLVFHDASSGSIDLAGASDS